MRIYSAAQLSTEIEAIKAQERGLLTMFEQQRYVEQAMKTDVEEFDEKIAEGTEIAVSDLEKLKENHARLTMEVEEDEDLVEEVAKFN